MEDFRYDQLEYDFKAVNPTDYECKLEIEVRGALMNKVFEQMGEEMRRRGKEITQSIDGVSGFDVPPDYLKRFGPMIKVQSRKTMAQIRKQVKQDGIEIISWDVTAMKYTRKDVGDWLVNITISGHYLDKR